MRVKLQQLLPLPTDTQLKADVIKLKNGLTLIHQYLPHTSVIAVDVWVKAGGIHEPENWYGMAHFLEHMIFKGSRRIAPGEFDYLVESTGSTSNAATGHDYAHFFLSTTGQHLPVTLPYLADILLDAEIPEEEFVYERNVVLEEIRGCYDDPSWIEFQSLCETIYQVHPYRRCLLGDIDMVMQHTPNQIRCFHRTHYQPHNMTVVVVGNVDLATTLSLVEESFQDFHTLSECPPTIVEAEPPLIGIRRTELELPRIEHNTISMGWLGPGVENLEDAIALDVISVLLAGGRTSTLVKELREQKQIVLDIMSGFSLQRDSSLFTINACGEANQCLTQIEEAICEQIDRLVHRGVTHKDLERAQRILYNDFVYSTETPAQLAGLYGYYHTIAKAEMSVMYPREILRLTPEQIQRIASQYLSSERYAVTTVKPCHIEK